MTNVDNPRLGELPAMIRNTITALRGYALWVRALPHASGMLFAARTSQGRSVKIFLFGIGVVLPLGSLIWAVLFWHGRGVTREHQRSALPRNRLHLGRESPQIAPQTK